MTGARMPDLSVSPASQQNLLLPGLERWPLDPDRPAIELIDVSLAFGDKVVLNGLSLKITPGITTVIVGPAARASRCCSSS